MNSVSDVETITRRLHSALLLSLSMTQFPSSTQGHSLGARNSQRWEFHTWQESCNLSAATKAFKYLLGRLVVDVVWRTTVPGVPIQGSRLYSYLEGRDRQMSGLRVNASYRNYNQP